MLEADFLAQDSKTGGFRFRAAIPRALPYFEGHFPGFPVLPGVVQIHGFVLPCVHRLRPDWGEVARVNKLKFVRPVLPEDVLELQLQLDDAQLRAAFVVTACGITCSEGRLAFAKR